MDTVTLIHPRKRNRLIFIEPVLSPEKSGRYTLAFQMQWVRYVPKDQDNE